MSILLPLYIYPWPGAWDPLHWAAWNHPNINFTVIVNPCSGPCIDTIPQADYLAEIPKLKDHPNVKTLGYVATTYANKPIDDVLAEIRRYDNYTKLLGNEKLGVDGIFFDETPGAYHWMKYAYLESAMYEVKNSTGLGERIIVHNPGALPDHTWNYLPLADHTVIFEDTFANLIDANRFNALKNFPAASNHSKSAFSIMVHSIGNVPDELVEWTADALKELTGWNFASSVTQAGEYWHSFSNLFDKFITYYSQDSGGGVNCRKESVLS